MSEEEKKVSKIDDENYYQVSGWMIKQLNLKGEELGIYAIIYGFTQNVNCFSGSLAYLEEFTNSTKPTVIKAIKSLLKKGLLEKEVIITDKGAFNVYRTVVKKFDMVKNFNSGGKETLPGGVKKLYSGGKETLPNNDIYNIYDITIDNIEDVQKNKKRFIKPSVDEVKAYCKEIDAEIDAEYFINYYDSNGWTVGKSKMKDWRAAVRNWKKRKQEYEKKKNTGYNSSQPNCRFATNLTSEEYRKGNNDPLNTAF